MTPTVSFVCRLPRHMLLFHVDTCALVEGVPFSLSNDQIHARSAEKAPSW